MQWQEIRDRYPDRWLLVEALAAHTESDNRILDQLDVVDTFSDSTSALRRYSQLHHEAPRRELYVLHTSRAILDITERQYRYRPHGSVAC